MNSTYLESLPTDAISKVVQCLSQTPSHRSWLSLVDASDLLTAYKLFPELPICAGYCFRSLHLPVHDKHGEIKWYIHNGIHGLALGTDFISELGPACSDLFFNALGYSSHLRNTDDLFLRSCLNVKRMCLSDGNKDFPLGEVLSKLINKLQELELSRFILGEEQAESIAEHCTDIKKLCFFGIEFVCPTEPIWESLGGSILELYLHLSRSQGPDAEDGATTLENISKYCTRVRNLSMIGFTDRVDTKQIVDICVGRGPELEILTLRDCIPHMELGASLSTSCPNVRIRMNLNALGKASLLENVAENVSVLDLIEADADFDETYQFLADCHNLSKLVLEYNEDIQDVIDAIFITPKPLLRDVRILLEYRFIPRRFQSVLQILSDNLKSLETLELDCELLPPGSFDALASSNANLKRVYIRLFAPSSTSNMVLGRILGSIAKAFLKCPILEELIVADFKSEVDGRRLPSYGARFGDVDKACGHVWLRVRYVLIWGLEYIR